VSPGARFCKKCGAAIGSAQADASTSGSSSKAQITVAADGEASALEGERKTVTALFADIKGSTELEQDLDPEEARAIVDPALKLMIDAVRRYDGYVVQSTGDGIFAMFGAPLAHEDHPQRAIHAAMRMQDEVRRYADRLRAQGRAPLQIRVGANTGEVVVRTIHTGAAKTEYTAIGHPVNLASRMQTLANPGSTVIAESTRKLVEGYFALKSLGASRVKGVSEPVNVYEVTGLGPLRTRLQRSAGRGYTKFVGREREMDAMRRALELAKQGQGQVIAIIGDAGVGKSRLVSEFKARAQSECLVLEAFSVSYGKASAWLPVIDLLKGYFRIADDDDPRTRREKVGGKVLMLERSLEDALAPLLALLGIADSAAQKVDDVPGFGDGGCGPAAGRAEHYKAPPAPRKPQPAAGADVRGPALDRRRDASSSGCFGREPCQRAHPAAGELSTRVPPRMGQQELLHPGAARPAWARERG
jgi:class 3 adenylate cyclase